MTAPNRIFKYPYTAHVCDTYGCFNRAVWAEGNPEGPRNQWIRRCDACMKAALSGLPAELMPQQPTFYALSFTPDGKAEVTDLEGNVLGKLQPSAGEFQLQVDLESRAITVLYAGAPVGEARIGDDVRDAIFRALEGLEDDGAGGDDAASPGRPETVPQPAALEAAGPDVQPASLNAAAGSSTRPCPNPECNAEVAVPAGAESVKCSNCGGTICVECWQYFRTSQGYGGHRFRTHQPTPTARQKAADLF